MKKSFITSAEESPENNQRRASTLVRGLEILDCFKFEDQYLGNSDIVKQTKLPKATVSRLTYTLTTLGYLQYSESKRKYNYGPSLVKIGYSLLANIKVRNVARPLMQALAEHIQGTVSLGMRENLHMVYVDTYQSAASFIYQFDCRKKLPLVSSAMGKAYLFSLVEEDRNKLLEQVRSQNEDNWPKIEQELDQAQKEYEATGYCSSSEGWHNGINSVAVPLGINSVAVPLILEDGNTFIFSCSGPSYQLKNPTFENRIGARLLNLVGNVKSALIIPQTV